MKKLFELMVQKRMMFGAQFLQKNRVFLNEHANTAIRSQSLQKIQSSPLFCFKHNQLLFSNKGYVRALTTQALASENEDPLKIAKSKLKAITFEDSLKKIQSWKNSKPSCFISYSWGITPHETLIHKLAGDLEKAGVKVLLDIHDNVPGTRIIRFTEKIENVDFVVLAGSLKLREKYNQEAGSVINMEIDQIATMLRHKPNSIIPILLEGTAKLAFPLFLEGVVYLDFKHQENYPNQVLELLRLLMPSHELRDEHKKTKTDYLKKIELLDNMPEQELINYFQRLTTIEKKKIQEVKDSLVENFNSWFAEQEGKSTPQP